MKRKVIQIANSTQLISLPRKWCVLYGIKKGDELEIDEQQNRLLISTGKELAPTAKEMSLEDYGILLVRSIHALYKQGVDEINITFENPKDFSLIQKALGKEAVGFEIIDQGKNFCVIKNVGSGLMDFDHVLRRTFLLLISMTEDGLKALRERDKMTLSNLAFLEEANNRFTTTCRRAINKGNQPIRLPGPLYCIVEQLEKIADQFKYFYNNIAIKDFSKCRFNSDLFMIHEKINRMLRGYYEIFYKLDNKTLIEIAQIRKESVPVLQKIMVSKSSSAEDIKYAHHLLVLIQDIFNLTGPLMVIKI